MSVAEHPPPIASRGRQCLPAAELAAVCETSLPGDSPPASWLVRALGWFMLAIAAPVIGLLVVAIRLTSPGGGIYSQVRLGRGGRVFTMYKLRSMRVDAEDRTGPVWASLRRDPRVTLLGHWLRVLHLDELPQLYNVARGDMALVGPRPERPSIAAVLAEKIPGYMDRLQVLPGITGLAQVNLPADSDLSSVRAKLQLDQEYIQTASLLLDIRIILCTLLRLVGLRGGRAVSLLGLKRVVVLPPADGPQDVVPVALPSPTYTSLEVRVGPNYAPISNPTEALNAPEPATAGPA
jgi:lipopolysaccharide/colanic/teichoic acid biosynthesis glycosyltransferase